MLLALAIVAIAADCSQHSSCAACTRGNGKDGVDAVCSWCFSQGRCMLAYSRANPKLEDWNAGPVSCTDSTSDLATCRCQPHLLTSCRTCSRGYSSCAWVQDVTTYATTTVTLPRTGEVKNVTTSHAWNDVCWPAGGFSGPSFPSSRVVGDGFEIALGATSGRWFWGGCVGSGRTGVWIFIAWCSLLSCCLGWSLLCCIVRRLVKRSPDDHESDEIRME